MTTYDERTGNAGQVGSVPRKPPTMTVYGQRFLSRPVAGLRGWWEVVCETHAPGQAVRVQQVAALECESDAEDLARFLATRGEAAA